MISIFDVKLNGQVSALAGITVVILHGTTLLQCLPTQCQPLCWELSKCLWFIYSGLASPLASEGGIISQIVDPFSQIADLYKATRL